MNDGKPTPTRRPIAGWVKPALVIAVLLGAAWFVGARVTLWLAAKPSPPPTETSVPGSFKLTDGQWATLSFSPAAPHAFRDQRDTDGKIAVDDDTTAPVFSPFSGPVTRLIARAGDRVKKGDPLLTVAASEFVQGQNDLASAAAALSAAQAQLSLAQRTEQRQHALFDGQGTALKDWQQSQADLAAADSAVKTAESGLAAARNRLRILGRGDGEIAQLERPVEAKTITAQATVFAPIAGTVLTRSVGPGQYVTGAASGGSPIFTIGDLSTLWLIGNLREADAALPRRGDAVEVTVPAYPGRIFQGKLDFVAPAIDPVSRRLMVRAEVKNPDGALKPEMFASFRLVSADGGVTNPAVPEAAVIYEGGSARLWVAHAADKTILLRQIKIGRTQDGLVEVTDGITAGESVVTKGALFIDRAAKGD